MPDDSTLPAAILAALLARIADDREAGGVQPVETYQALFPGYEEGVARKVAEVAAEKADAGGGVSGFLEAGDTFGSYRVEAMLGQGGQGVVYRARDQRLSRVVALKILDIRGPGMGDAFTRFQREASVAARLQHPGICAVFESGIEDGVPFIAMQYVEGTSISDIFTTLKERSSGDTESFHATFGGEDDATEAKATPADLDTATDLSGPVRAELDAVLEIVEQSARALHVAHEEGVVHRDIKPGNIMVRPDGSPVILDFGLAHDMLGEGVTLTRPGELFGTPAYMSPEQLLHNQVALDRRTDVWSLGVVAYEYLTYRRPFDAPTRQGLYQAIVAREPSDPRKINPAISKDLATVLETALDKDRDGRYQTALDLAEDLRRVREFEPIQARPATGWTRLKRWAQRNRAVAASLATVLLALTVGLVVSLSLLAEVRRGKQAADAAREAEVERSAELGRAVDAREQALSGKDAALRASESLRLLAESAAALPENPGLALLLAVEVANRGGERRAMLNNGLVAAASACRELAQITPDFSSADVTSGRVAMTSAFYGGQGDGIFTTSYFSRGMALVARVHLWDGDGRLRSTMEAPPRQHFRQVALSPDGRTLACTLGGNRTLEYPDGQTAYFTDRVVRLWDIPSGREIHVLKGHTQPVVAVRFSADGRRIVTASWDGTARVWDAYAGREVGVIETTEGALLDARFSPDGSRVLTRAEGGKRTRDYRAAGGLGRLGGTRKGEEVDPPLSSRRAWSGYQLVSGGSGESWATRNLRHVGVRLWDAKSFEEASPPIGGSEGTLFDFIGVRPAVATCALFTSDGDRVVVGTSKSVMILSAADGKELATHKLSKGSLRSMALSRDDRRVLLAHDDRVSILNLADGKEERRFPTVRGGVRDAYFGEDDTYVVVVPGKRPRHENHRPLRQSPSGEGDAARSVMVFDAKGGHLVAALRGHVGDVVAASSHPDGERLVTASLDGTARVWTLSPDRALEKVLWRGDAVTGASFSPDGRRVVVFGSWRDQKRRRFATIVDVETGEEATALEWRGDPRMPAKARALVAQALGSTLSAEFSPDGGRVLTLSKDDQARVQGEKIARRSRGSVRAAAEAAEAAARAAEEAARGGAARGQPDPRDMEDTFGAYEKMFFAPVRLWDASTGAMVFSLQGLKQEVDAAFFSPDGARILTRSSGSVSFDLFRAMSPLSKRGSGSQTSEDPPLLRVWDARTGKLTHTVGTLGTVRDRRWGRVAWRPDGHGFYESTRRWLVDLKVGAAYQLSIPRELRFDGEICFSPGGRFLAVFRRGWRTAAILDLSTLAVVGDNETGTQPAGGRGAAARDRVQIRVFTDDPAGVASSHEEVRERACRSTQLVHEGGVYDAAFSADSRWLATVSSDGWGRIWAAATGALKWELKSHQVAVRLVAFSPDGAKLATIGDDLAIRLWDPATGAELLTLRGHGDAITSLAFSPDGQHVLTASKDGTVRRWPVDPLPTAQARVPRAFTAEERLRYRLPKDK